MKYREDIAVVTGYIMYYDLLEAMNGSFFTKIDRAIELATKFAEVYPEDFKWGEEENPDFEETIEKFLAENLVNGK